MSRRQSSAPQSTVSALCTFLLVTTIVFVVSTFPAQAQGSDQCSVSISTSPDSPVPSGTPVTINATLTGDVVVDTVNATVNSDTGQSCNLSTNSTLNCSIKVDSPSSGTHTVSWGCSAFGAGGSGRNSGSQTFTVQPANPMGSIGPKYIVLAVTYAPPGSNSNVSYTNSTMLGTSN